MIPATLSASSLQVYQLCPDRWVAEYLNRARGFSNAAADVGTAVHGGLEGFVKAVFIDKTHTGLDRVAQKELLISFYQMSYVATFNTADMETDEYKDGFHLTMKWFERTDLNGTEVVSVESKKTIEIPFNHPDGTSHKCEHCAHSETPGVCYIPFNYIMDRVDKTGETTYEVVDYKTVRVPIQPEDLENKLQARAYSLAVQIEHPDATEVKVTFDLLRHDKISLTFKRDDNIAFWRFLCSTTQRIVDTKPEDARPVLNPECGYCVKKFSCPLMKKDVAVGGIHSLSIDEKAQLMADLEAQTKANGYIIEALNEQLLIHAAHIEELSWETEAGDYEVEVKGSRRRKFPAHQAAAIMGPELFAQMGSMTLGNLDKIIKDESLDPDMRKQLEALVAWEQSGELKAKVKPKKKVV